MYPFINFQDIIYSQVLNQSYPYVSGDKYLLWEFFICSENM